LDVRKAASAEPLGWMLEEGKPTLGKQMCDDEAAVRSKGEIEE